MTTLYTGPSLLDAALSYAARGWHVFPCHTPVDAGCSCRRACGRIGKHPRTQHGLKDATPDEATIRRWWRQWPQANIGIATGAVSGLVVLDEDTYKGGDASRIDLERSYSPLPETGQQLTGGGGVQYFFAYPGSHVKNGVETLGTGLDIRGDGGYVIVPPSLHASGTCYAWEISHLPDEISLAAIPPWLLALCQDTTRRTAPNAGEPIPQGQRNQTLFQLGCAMRARGFSEAAIAGALTAINTTQCQPPLAAAEVDTIAASCAQYPDGTTQQDARQSSNGRPTPDTPGPAAIGDAAPVEDTRPVIKISTEITAVVDQGQAALLALPEAPVIFQRARRLCIIARGVKPPRWLHRPQDAPVILEGSPALLCELASHAARWQKYDARKNTWNAALPPSWFVETLQGRPAWPFPVLEGIIGAPTLRPDGSVLDTPDYDVSTGLWFDSNGTHYPALADHPTLDDARNAVNAVRDVLQDFPFVGSGFAAALSAVLSIVCRFTIRGCVPLFAARSTTRGSGKGLLIDVLSIIGTGRPAPRWPQSDNDEEDRKRLLTVAMAGDATMHIDNVVKPLGSPALDLALTASSVTDRILGKSAKVEAPLTLVWFASGNNMQFKGDTARRVVPMDIDAQMERPEERTGFVYPRLLDHIRHVRPALVSAALTIVHAYFQAGTPTQGLSAYGSFQEWSDLIRAAVVWAADADPCEGRKGLEAESDPVFDRLSTLLDCWEECYGNAEATIAQALQDVSLRATPIDMNNPPNKWHALHSALCAFDPTYRGHQLDPRVLGNTVNKSAGRIIGGKRLLRGHTRTKTGYPWRVNSLQLPVAGVAGVAGVSNPYTNLESVRSVRVDTSQSQREKTERESLTLSGKALATVTPDTPATPALDREVFEV